MIALLAAMTGPGRPRIRPVGLTRPHTANYVSRLIHAAGADRDYLLGLVRELCKLRMRPLGRSSSDEYISALANAATLHGKAQAYLLWGVENGTHAIAGTGFSPAAAKTGNEPLETWLLRLLSPRIDFRFHEVMADGRRVVLLEIDRASRQPVAFNGTEFIRVGSTKRRLEEYPEKERALWRVLDRVDFEDGMAAERMSGESVLLKLDYPAYFDLLDTPLPDGHAAILDVLQRDLLIAPCEAGGYDITNLGAILLAKNLGDFRRLQRKAIRVIEYRGSGRTETSREQERCQGLCLWFRGADRLHKRPTAGERGHRSGAAPDGTGVSRNCGTRIGGKCPDTSGLSGNRRRTAGGDLPWPH